MNENFIHPLFSKPLYGKFTDIDTKKIISAIRESDFRDAGRHDMKNDVSHISSVSNNLYVLNDKKFKFLKDIIIKELYLYVSDVLKYTNKFEITTSWFTKSSKGQSSNAHHHSNCMISGVLYLQTKENSGDISFTDFNDRRYSLSTKEWNIFNSAFWKIKPVDGLLLMFPSEVYHTIHENESDVTRYSLAFNIMPKGLIGAPDTDSHMTIKFK